MFTYVRFAIIGALGILLGAIGTPAAADSPAGLSADDAKQIDRDLKQLDDRLRALRKDKPDLAADAEVFRKGVVWALRYETKLEPADATLIKKALARCTERIEALAAGK